jgi:hypothetical protein
MDLMAQMENVDEGESEDSSKDEEAALPVSGVVSPKQSRPGSSMDNHIMDVRKMKNIHLRVLNLEKRMTKIQINPAPVVHLRTPSHSSAREVRFEEHGLREDWENEIHLKYSDLVQNVLELKEMFSSQLKTPLPDLQEGQRAQLIEIASQRAKNPNDERLIKTSIDRSELQKSLGSLQEGLRREMAELQEQLRAEFEDGLNEVRSALMTQPTGVNDAVNVSLSDVSEIANLSAMRVLHVRLQKEVKDMRGELNELSLQQGKGPSADDDRLNRYWFELKELKSSLAANEEAVRLELHERLKQLGQDFEENLNGVHSHLMGQLSDINDAINAPSDTSENGNLSVMRALNIRLQRDIREIRGELSELTQQQAKSSLMQVAFTSHELADDVVVDAGGNRNWGASIQKHEAMLKTLHLQVVSLSAELETQQSMVKKTQEQQLSQSIKQLEELRQNVSGIMAKVQEGSKLNQKDLEKLNELYRQLEGKSDREEISQKVDKRDLNRAYRFLSKKIESLSKDMERTERASTSQLEEPAALRKKLDAQCLACGQDVGAIPLKLDREWKSWGRFPPNTYRVIARQFGPGFSKILPMLKTSVEPNRSETVRTERLRNGSNPELRRSIGDLAQISLPSTHRTVKGKTKQDSPR